MTSQTDLLTKLNTEYIKIDPTNKIWDTASKASFLQRGYLQIQKDGGYRWRENQTSTTITPVAGTREYALPSDFVKLDQLVRLGLPVHKTTKEYVNILNPNNVQGSPYLYYIYGTNLGFEPIPSDATTITHMYFKRLPTITSAQASLLPSDFDDAICAYAAYVAFNSVEKVAKAQAMFADYQQHLNTLLATYLYDDMDVTVGRVRAGNFVGRDDVIYPGQ